MQPISQPTPQQPLTGLEKYEKLTDIGKGSFGVVSKIRRKADGRILVWKELNYGKMSEKEKQMIVSEVNILREMRHPHIVRYYDRIIDREQAKIYIIMEYCEGGDIATLIKSCKKDKNYMPEDLIWTVLAQMISALQHCHCRKEGKILHRDLKPGNIFLDSNRNVKLGDFGLSKMMGEESLFAYTHVGTPYYMSPEQINDQKYNEKSDIWSAGCIIYEVAALRAPFEATKHYELALKIKAGRVERIPNMYTDELMNVIQCMLHQDPLMRPSVEQLMEHPQILVRLQEYKLNKMKENLKRKELDLQKRVQELIDKDSDIKKRRLALQEKEKQLRYWEKQLDEQEKQLDQEEQDFDKENKQNASSFATSKFQPQNQPVQSIDKTQQSKRASTSAAYRQTYENLTKKYGGSYNY